MHNPIVITHALRTPFGHFEGMFQEVSAPELASWVIRDLCARVPSSLAPDLLTIGCVLSAGLGQAPARQALFKSGLPLSVPASLVNKVCGSGMESHILSFLSLRAEESKVCLSGGMESMSQAPYLLPRSHARIGHFQAQDSLMHDGLTDFAHNKVMGMLAEEAAHQFSITRTDQEESLVQSIQKAKKAYENGFFSSQLISPPAPFDKYIQDEKLEKINIEKIPNLKPSFGGTITPATASSLSDGAAFSLMMHHSTALESGLTPLCAMVGYSHYSGETKDFTSAPVHAIQKLLHKLEWRLHEVDYFEVNEAFMLVPLIAAKELSINHNRLNVHGGACTLGHPLGATGARILGNLAHILASGSGKKGIASICIGGGEGIAIALEAIKLS